MIFFRVNFYETDAVKCCEEVFIWREDNACKTLIFLTLSMKIFIASYKAV